LPRYLKLLHLLQCISAYTALGLWRDIVAYPGVFRTQQKTHRLHVEDCWEHATSTKSSAKSKRLNINLCVKSVIPLIFTEI